MGWREGSIREGVLPTLARVSPSVLDQLQEYKYLDE